MHTVIGAFEDRASAERAVERLVEAGLDRSDIHVEDRQAGGLGDDAAERTSGEHRGMFSQFFASLFGDDDRTRRPVYAEAVRRGSSVVVLDAADEAQAERASALMNESGAYDIDARTAEWRTEGWTGYEAGDADLAAEGKLNVVQEEVKVGKRLVDKGGVRIVQRVSEKPVREIVRLREEVASVERRPVDRPASAEDLDTFREGSFEVRETVEEPVVSKTARVVEEVRVGKDVREREETIEDSVRRKDVDVERMEGTGASPTVERDERAFAADRRERGTLPTGERDLIDKDKPR